MFYIFINCVKKPKHLKYYTIDSIIMPSGVDLQGLTDQSRIDSIFKGIVERSR